MRKVKLNEIKEMTGMDYEIRLATDADIAPALDLAWHMFVKYDSSDYGAEHTERMRQAIEDRLKDFSIYNQRLMVVALADGKVVGMIETYGTERINKCTKDQAIAGCHIGAYQPAQYG